MTKPLYVEGKSKTKIALDGPSLEVLAEGSARRRFPLCRVSRLLAWGEVEWSHEALVACLDHGIPVTFLAGDGSARGFGVPACDPATRDNQRIEALLARSDWASVYGDWIRSQERREILHVLKLAGLRVSDLRPEAVREAVEEELSLVAPIGLCRRLKTKLEGFLAGRISEHVARAGLAPFVVVDRRPGFHLPRDAVRVLSWRLYGDVKRYVGGMESGAAAPAGSAKPVAGFYESFTAREDRRIARFLDSFRFWLGGLA